MSTIDRTISNGFAETARTDLREIVRRLNSHLGPTLVAALAGVKERRQPIRWAKPDGPEINDKAARRVQLAHRAWSSISNAESDSVARAWFIGSNPRLREDTPLTAIREDRHRDVMAAVIAFLEDTYDG